MRINPGSILEMRKRVSYVGDDGFDDPALVGHVGDHGNHVVVGRPDEVGSEDDGEVTRLHLVDVTVVDDVPQVHHQVVQSLIMVIRQFVNLSTEKQMFLNTDSGSISKGLVMNGGSMYQFLEGEHTLYVGLQLVGLDEERVQVAGEERFRELAEERLQQAGYDVDVIPPRVLQVEAFEALVDGILEGGDGCVVPRYAVDADDLQTLGLDDLRAQLNEQRNVLKTEVRFHTS